RLGGKNPGLAGRGRGFESPPCPPSAEGLRARHLPSPGLSSPTRKTETVSPPPRDSPMTPHLPRQIPPLSSSSPPRYEKSSRELVNEELGIAYPVVDGVPDLTPRAARPAPRPPARP
uniref:Uncharacterized protein n=1 Tax=Ornithorhynchus anatinus TaxID=9258 RepID=A0A6I8P1X1_ORNAN